ncbi:MAG TPA: cyclopropane-fatty-acyl-phospholipid synthase family protein [Roseiarcus sp.]|nr:cyclopropane-fatty-acyl-phospholipid synthase family protein [Roseiarcus sp.]
MSQSEEASVSWLGAEEAADAQSDRRLGLLEPLVANLRGGRLRIVLPNGRAIVSPADRGGLQGTLVIERWRALRRLALGGDVGFAEAYVDGDWTSPDPVALLRIAAHNFEPLREATQGSALFRWADRLRHLARGNTRRGSRRNIMAHYDLGNDFYELWLDPTMQYSSALWTEDTPDLEAAQALKLNRVVELLDLSGGESVLEIGCGWGSLATRLAETEGAGVTAITLSPAQLAFARARATSRGCDRRVDFRLLDYRDVSGRFDRVVSIEMLEAVGEARWPRYFQTVAKSLKAGGRAVLQTITIDEAYYEHYRRNPDFIQKHVFPGGFLPSKPALEAQIEQAGLRVVERQSFGSSYARTLAEWRTRFLSRWPEVAALGFDDRFRRLWDYYLAYCEAGFAEGTIDVTLLSIAHRRRGGGKDA